MNTDVLIVGAGVAGLVCAIELGKKRPDLSITILDKTEGESNTLYAQGGIAAVNTQLKDSFLTHIADTLTAGNYEGNSETISRIVEAAPKAISFLHSCGVEFDLYPDGNPKLGLEGGHSHPRIFHHQDRTGKEIIAKLRNEIYSLPNVRMFNNHLATDLLVSKQGQCYGVQVIDWIGFKKIELRSSIVILCTGGSGQIFERTTNPCLATADGIGMAIRKGVVCENLSNFQFHPTALYNANSSQSPLITEALRGAGAHIVNDKGARFLFDGHTDGELAPRDVVSKLIWKEMESTGEKHVFLDARHLDKEVLENDFPGVLETCRSFGLEMKEGLLPITPAAHYQCGGITVNLNGETSLENLYALGECAHTGMHGSNRLASNSLLEGVVCARWTAEHLAGRLLAQTIQDPYFESFIKAKPSSIKKAKKIRKDLQQFMTSLYGATINCLKMNTKHFHTWKQEIESIIDEENLSPEILETRNLIYAADALCYHMKRKNQYAKHHQDI